tara:strand:+ start:56 stop:328 length:273 start_codon:yes stop_codon:yes gene_type:complete
MLIGLTSTPFAGGKVGAALLQDGGVIKHLPPLYVFSNLVCADCVLAILALTWSDMLPFFSPYVLYGGTLHVALLALLSLLSDDDIYIYYS